MVSMAKIQLRRDSAVDWSKTNPVLLVGEAGYEWEFKRLKIGDGITPYHDLLYYHIGDEPVIESTKVVDSTLTTDGTVQTLLSYTPSSEPRFISGWLDLFNMSVGDTIVIITTVNEKQHLKETYSNQAGLPMIYFEPRPIGVDDTYTITIQRTAGTDRSYGYQFFSTF